MTTSTTQNNTPMNKRRKICKICNEPFETIVWNRSHCTKHECMNESFWNEKVEYMKAGDIAPYGQISVRTKRLHFMIFDENEKTDYRGYGGKRFLVKFTAGPHKGKIIQTTNLYHNGIIPLKHAKALTNNCVWIDNEKPTHKLVSGKLERIA